MNDLTKQDLKTFMEARAFCVIATVGTDSRPEAAFVGYSSNEKHQVIVGTSNKTRKFKNIAQNKSVALVIADMTGEVQYEGDVEVITKPDYDSLATEGFSKLEGFSKYRDDPDQVILKITPTWIRLIIHGPSGVGADQSVLFTEFA